MSFKNKVQSFFKLNGLILKAEGVEKIVKYSETHECNVVESDKLLSDTLAFILNNENLSTSIVNVNIIDKALKMKFDQKFKEKIFYVYNVFSDIPQLAYDAEANKIKRIDSSSINMLGKSLIGSEDSKAQLFLLRYYIIYYRLTNSTLFSFTNSSFIVKNKEIQEDNHETEKKFQIKPIVYLLGQAHPEEHIICLGMLMRSNKNQLFIEDPSGTIRIDIFEAAWHEGIFTEGCFVLAEGYVQNNILHTFAIGFPPIEHEKNSRRHLGDANLFGSDPPINPKLTLTQDGTMSCPDIEDRLVETGEFYVILSDLFLDVSKVKEKFQTLLAGFEHNPPVCFIICGPFVSPGSTILQGDKQNLKQTYKSLFAELSRGISKYPNLLKRSKFVFVPHVRDDPGMSGILPRPSVPPCLVKEFFKPTTANLFTKAAPGTEARDTFYFASNPCRIQHRSHQIVIFREDIMNKMFRNTVHSPSSPHPTSPGGVGSEVETDEAKRDITYHFCQTIMSQCHLAPLPLTVCPRFWEFEHALMLYPLPDLIVCADKYLAYTGGTDGCTILNPGSFSRHNFTFKVFYPFQRSVEDSAVP